MANIEKPNVPTVTPPSYGSPISAAQAAKVMKAAEDCAAAEGWPMVIAIVDSTGSLLMLHRHDQAQRASVEIAINKAMVAVNFRRPTKFFEDALSGGSMRILGMPNMTPLEGGIPIMQDGKLIGGIGVSGMHSAQDAYVALHGLAVLESA